MKKKVKISLNKKVLIPSLFVLIILVAFFIGYRLIVFQNNLNWNDIYNSYTTPTPAVFYRQPKPAATPVGTFGWHLEKTVDGTVKTLFILGLNSVSVVRWNNLIFYPVSLSNMNNDNYIQIHEFNLDNETDSIVFDQNTQKNFPQSRGIAGFSQMEVINNTLYFWYGGYLSGAGVFALPLPVTGQAKLLATADGPEVIYYKNHYWIYASDGDACGGWSSYYLLDIINNVATHVANTVSGCSQGEEYLGIDASDRMLVSYYTGWSTNQAGGNYTYIYAIPLNNPVQKVGIIAKQDMPQGVTNVTYLQDTNQLLLSGKNNFLVDLSSNTLSPINQIPATPSPQAIYFPYNSPTKLADQIQALNLPSQYQFVLK